jgi:hypothetical protein
LNGPEEYRCFLSAYSCDHNIIAPQRRTEGRDLTFENLASARATYTAIFLSIPRCFSIAVARVRRWSIYFENAAWGCRFAA